MNYITDRKDRTGRIANKIFKPRWDELINEENIHF